MTENYYVPRSAVREMRTAEALREEPGGAGMGAMSKAWGEGDARRAHAREADLHVSLSEDDLYASHHEALRRAADLLVESLDDAVGRMRRQAEREGHETPDEIEALYGDEREYHVRKVAGILLEEAVKKWAGGRE